MICFPRYSAALTEWWMTETLSAKSSLIIGNLSMMTNSFQAGQSSFCFSPRLLASFFFFGCARLHMYGNVLFWPLVVSVCKKKQWNINIKINTWSCTKISLYGLKLMNADSLFSQAIFFFFLNTSCSCIYVCPVNSVFNTFCLQLPIYGAKWFRSPADWNETLRDTGDILITVTILFGENAQPVKEVNKTTVCRKKEKKKKKKKNRQRKYNLPVLIQVHPVCM